MLRVPRLARTLLRAWNELPSTLINTNLCAKSHPCRAGKRNNRREYDLAALRPPTARRTRKGRWSAAAPACLDHDTSATPRAELAKAAGVSEAPPKPSVKAPGADSWRSNTSLAILVHPLSAGTLKGPIRKKVHGQPEGILGILGIQLVNYSRRAREAGYESDSQRFQHANNYFVRAREGKTPRRPPTSPQHFTAVTVPQHSPNPPNSPKYFLRFIVHKCATTLAFKGLSSYIGNHECTTRRSSEQRTKHPVGRFKS